MDKILLKIVLLVVLVLSVFLVSDFLQSLNALKLEIRSDKQVYETGDPINVEYDLKNTGSQPININSNFILFRDIVPHFSQTVGGDLDWLSTDPAMAPNESSYVEIKPGETLINKIDALESFLAITDSEGYLPPGRYVITLDYIGSADATNVNAHNAWKGSLNSNTVEILVRKKAE